MVILDQDSKVNATRQDITDILPTPESPASELEQLRAEAAYLTTENAQISDRIRDGYVQLLKMLDPKDPLRSQVVAAKKELDARLKALHPPEITAQVEQSIELDPRLNDEAVIPTADREHFLESFNQLPNHLQREYCKRLSSSLKSKDEATRITGIRGAAFEMSRIVILAKQGLEQVDLSDAGPRNISVTYMGYKKPKNGVMIDYSLAPTNQYQNGEIDLDVPMVRGGRPYIYETKSYPRRQYGGGADPQNRNQLLKYQAAIEQGLVDGATVEINGRLDPEFLDWAMGEKLDDPGHAPDVEIIYTFDLPSGKEYRFVLKRSQHRDGLEFRNEEQYDTADQEVIRGIQQSLSDKSIKRLITGVNIEPERASPELRAFLADPTQITTRELFEEYDQLRRQTVTEILRAKIADARINSENRKSAVSEYATPIYVEHLIREYQDFLRQNPEIAKIKSAYVLGEELIPLAIERTMAAIAKIAAHEQSRRDITSGEFASEAARIKDLRKNGYSGRPEGVALDIDHIMMDVIYSINKTGVDRATVEKIVGVHNIDLFTSPGETPESIVLLYRSRAELEAAISNDENIELRKAYDKMSRPQKERLDKLFREAEFVRSYEWPARFAKIETLPEFLKDQDRHYMELQILDSRDGMVTRQTDTNFAEIQRTEYTLLRENIQRAKEYVEGTPREMQNKRAIHAVEAVIQRLETERDQKIKEVEPVAKQEAARIGQVISALKKRRSEQVSAGTPAKDIADIDRQISELEGQRTKAFSQLRQVSAEYQAQIQSKYRELERIYQTVIPRAEWDTFAKRITAVIDQNIIKFIYVVTDEGEVIVQEEVVRGDVSGRAAHSELAQGRNVYGAGELAFTKKDGSWVLTEVNNGSGHYRPDALTTLPYVKSAIARKGINVDQAIPVDSILRGVPLKDASAF